MAWVRLDSPLRAVHDKTQSRPPSRPSRRILFDATNAQGEGLMLFFRHKTTGTGVPSGKQVMQLFIGIQHGHSAPRPGEASVTLLCEMGTQVRHTDSTRGKYTPIRDTIA